MAYRRRTRMMMPKRSVNWASATIAPLQLNPGASAFLPITPGSLGGMFEIGTPTLTRVIGSLRILNAGTSGQDTFGAAGLIVSGAASAPSPYGTDAGKDWFWHKYFWLPNLSGSSVEARFFHFEIDTKAQRKIGDTDDIIFAITNAVASTAVLRYFVSFRILIKRPR